MPGMSTYFQHDIGARVLWAGHYWRVVMWRATRGEVTRYEQYGLVPLPPVPGTLMTWADAADVQPAEEDTR